MAYSDFTLELVVEKLGVTTGLASLFPGAIPVAPPDWLLAGFARNTLLATASEQSRRESLIAPILSAAREVTGDRLAIFSGQRMDIDSSRGLNGECDYLLAVSQAVPPLRPPLIAVVEAKKADIDLGLGQCAAEMIAAREFNHRMSKTERPVYGCVTSGEVWLFLRLRETHVDLDATRFLLSDVHKILGVFRAILEEYDRLKAA